MLQLRAAVLAVLVASPMAGLGCTTTPCEKSNLSKQACEVPVALRQGRGVITLKGDTDNWLIMSNPDQMNAFIFRLGPLGTTGVQVGPDHRSIGLVLTDGDAADVFRRVTGKVHPTLKGELSEEYKAFVKGRR